MGEANANRNHKDTIFRLLFGEDKRALLSLYNALNETNYDNPDDLTVNTLKDSLYLGMKNDISFVMKEEVLLYEHQGSYNPNIPLRSLLYISELLKIIMQDKNLYGKKMLKIPAPQFVVLYNGDEERPEKEILRLSDMYEGKQGGLELEVLCYNINIGYNEKLMVACQLLREYSIFIGKIKEYRKKMPLKGACDIAVKECVNEGILRDFILKYGLEATVMNFLYEFDAEKQRELDRRDGYEDGMENGMTIGMDKGRQEGRQEIVLRNIKKGRTIEELADLLGISEDEVIELSKMELQER